MPRTPGTDRRETISHARCFYTDPAKRGSQSPDCFPGTFARYVVRSYFIRTFRNGRVRRAPLHLCRAHAEFHEHLSPRPMNPSHKAQ